MAMRIHELHPTLVHAPLVLLPTAAVVDVLAVTSSGRIRRRAYSAIGRGLWWGVAVSGLTAGLAGMAASQEVEADDHARDMMLVHGLGNLGLVVAAFGVAAWRSRNRATAASAGLGVGAVAAALYTAWLGGELVYGHGVGVKQHDDASADPMRSPPLLSRHAPGALVRDAVKGLGWLLRRGAATAPGEDTVRLESVSPGRETASESGPPAMH
jgi:uncharacterized membrane protein